jgi:site-specific DNA-methyltransferase (adenine-specific)/modification methylase
VLPLLPPCDLILTDPPYGAAYAANPIVGKGKAQSNHEAMDWDNCTPPPWLFGLLLEKAATVIVWGGNYFPAALDACKGWLVWDKENGDNGYADCELAWSNLPQAIRRIKYRWAGMLQQDMANKEEREHPTQKPLELLQKWVVQFSDSGETILDPFMGSGTTGVACVNLGRKFIGIELEPKYFDIACKRIEKAISDQRLLDMMEQPQDSLAQAELFAATT